MNMLELAKSRVKKTDVNKQLDTMTATMFDAPNPTKERIVAFTKKYFDWIKKSPAKKLIASVKKLVEDKECTCCHGTGTFVGKRYTRTCFRCKGKGTMDSADQARHAAYTAKGDERKVSFSSFESANGSNTWGFVA